MHCQGGRVSTAASCAKSGVPFHLLEVSGAPRGVGQEGLADREPRASYVRKHTIEYDSIDCGILDGLP